MNLSFVIDVQIFGLTASVQIDGSYTHGQFDPESVFLYRLTDKAQDTGPISQRTGIYMPDVSDFYCAHAKAIDEAVRAELADHAEAAADTYEAQRQDEIDDNAERARS